MGRSDGSSSRKRSDDAPAASPATRGVLGSPSTQPVSPRRTRVSFMPEVEAAHPDLDDVLPPLPSDSRTSLDARDASRSTDTLLSVDTGAVRLGPLQPSLMSSTPSPRSRDVAAFIRDMPPAPQPGGDGSSPRIRILPITPRGAVARPHSLVRPDRSRSRARSASRHHRGQLPGGTAPEEDQQDAGSGLLSCSIWAWIARILTYCCCACCLKRCGRPDPLMQQAWREKTALCLIVFSLCVALGFLTFGFTTVVCRPNNFVYKHADVVAQNGTDRRYYIIHGYIYNVPDKYQPYPHPDSPADPFPIFAGYDITVFFPYNPTCQAHGYYSSFRCAYPNLPFEHCHGTDIIAGLDRVGQVNWDWSELEGSTTRFAYNGFVLDVGYYLSQVPAWGPYPYGKEVDTIFRQSVGGDATKALSGLDSSLLMCLMENFGAGTLDVKSVGCILTDIVLYVSLVAILAVILVKFFLAVYFTCVFSRKLCDYEAKKASRRRGSKAAALDVGQAGGQCAALGAADDTASSAPFAASDAELSDGGVGGAGGLSDDASLQADPSVAGSSASLRKPKHLTKRSQSTLDLESGFGRSDSLASMGRRPSHISLSGSEGTLPGGGAASSGTLPTRGRQASVVSVNASTPNGSSSYGTLPRQGRFSSRFASAQQRHLQPPRQPAGPMGPTGASTPSAPSAPFTAPFFAAPPSPSMALAPRVPLPKTDADIMYTLLMITCYSEGEAGLRATIESLCATDYPDEHKMLFIVADGLIVGSGNERSTPQILVDMMEIDPLAGTVDGRPWSEATSRSTAGPANGPATGSTLPPDPNRPKPRPMAVDPSAPPDPSLPPAYSYVAIADGRKRHNMARVFAGHYVAGGHRVPALVVVKCGTADEAHAAKPGNRGKRDSQIVLMQFLSKVLFDDRMTPLEYDMYVKVKSLLGVTADVFEAVLCVDADTIVMPDALTHITAVMKMDPSIMGLCGETKISNKSQSWVTAIQVFEYFISHHLNKAFESIFGGVTCLPGCFCAYRIKAPKGPYGYFVPILANPDIIDLYSENVTDTLHKKNLLLLGEDRYLTTLMLKTFPKRKLVFVPVAQCKTQVPDTFKVLLSQRRRWINSTVHNLFELVLVRDLCGTFCCSMQFIIFMELVGTLVLPAAIVFTAVLISSSFWGPPQWIPLGLLAAILGLPSLLIFFTHRSFSYFIYMIIYLFSLPVWNFVLPVYAYWHFDDFSWGETRKVAGAEGHGGAKDGHGDKDGVFDSSQIYMRRCHEYEAEVAKGRLGAVGAPVPEAVIGAALGLASAPSRHPLASKSDDLPGSG